MITFMIYATVMATLFALAAARVEVALIGRGYPTRWVWVTSVGASLAIGALALLRPPTVEAPHMPGWVEPAWVVLADFRDLAAGSPTLWDRADAVAPWFWGAASLFLLMTSAAGIFRLGRRARRWIPARVSEALVFLSDDFGPAVFGVRAPRVVLPRWTLTLAPDRLRLVVLHEEEHRRAGDAALLLAGWLAVVAAPWNVALWWQFRRLRGAVEVDCDARVLRRGAPAELYGRMLLELGTRDAGLRIPVAAFSRPPSLLERRLTMIVRGGSRGSVRRSLGAVAVATVLVFVACETPMPTGVRPSPDTGVEAESVDGMTAPVVAPRIEKIEGLLTQVEQDGAQPLYMVDGKRVASVADIAPENIVRVEVVKGASAERVYGPDAHGGVVHIVTVDAPMDFRAPENRPQAGEREQVRLPKDVKVFVDGRPFEGDIESIAKETIDRVEVVKAKQEGGASTIYITLKR